MTEDDYITEIYNEVDMAIHSNDNSVVHKIMNDPKYCSLTTDQKEEYIFSGANFPFYYGKKGESLLSYLIFEYKIKEENSLNKIGSYKTKEVESMFKARELNDELDTKEQLSLNRVKKI